MNKSTKLQDNIYLDYQATTPLDPRVLSEMLPYFNERFGILTFTTEIYYAK